MRRFLHHLAEPSRQSELPLSGDQPHLEGQQITTHLGPGEAGDDSHLFLLFPGSKPMFGNPQVLFQLVPFDPEVLLLAAFDEPKGHSTADLADHPLQVSNSALPGVTADDLLQGLLRQFQVLFLEAVEGLLLLKQIVLGDLQLLQLRVPGDLDHFHTVHQSRRNGLKVVGGGDEEDIGEVELNIQIPVDELLVLLRVEDFQEGRGGISSEIGGHLVHLVQEEDGVSGPGPLDLVNDLPGVGAYVGSPVPLDLGLIPHATQGEVDELPPHGLGNGLGQGALSHAGRAHEAENRALGNLHEVTDRQELEDSLLDLLQTEVFALKNPPGLFEVFPLFGPGLPGEGHHPVHVASGNRRLRGGRGHHLKPFQLFEGLLPGGLGHPRLLNLLSKRLNLGVIGDVLLFRQGRRGARDGTFLPLFAREGRALPPLTPGSDLLTQVGGKSEDPLQRVDDLQKVLLIRQRKGKLGGDDVDNPLRIAGNRRRDDRLQGTLRRKRHKLLEELHHQSEVLLKILGVVGDLRKLFDQDLIVGVEADVLDHSGPPDRLDHNLDVVVLGLGGLDDPGFHTDGVHVLRLGKVDGWVELGREEESLVLGEGHVQCGEGGMTPDEKGDQGRRKDHHLPKGDQRQGTVIFGYVLHSPAAFLNSWNRRFFSLTISSVMVKLSKPRLSGR